MSCIVRSFNKKSQTTYIYESSSYRDPITKKPCAHRKLIGKLDPATGQMIPTGNRGRPRKATAEASPTKDASAEAESETINKLRTQLIEMTAKYHESDAKAKALDTELRDMKFRMRQIATSLKALGVAADQIQANCTGI